MPLVEEALQSLGDEISDPDIETFTTFCQPIPSQNLGFVDAKAITLHLTVAGRDLTIKQSPTLLLSNRQGGTTGAVAWTVTPLFADWLAQETNWLFGKGEGSILGPESTVVELGCGVSGVNALTLAPRVGRYVCTDQEYVFKTLKANLEENARGVSSPPSTKKQSNNARKARKVAPAPATAAATTAATTALDDGVIEILPLDWELDTVTGLSNPFSSSSAISHAHDGTVDLVIACDCIYNEALIEPFVRTCAEICGLNTHPPNTQPAVCIVAQQLRSDSVFNTWLSAFHRLFRVWRMPDRFLRSGLEDGSGFVVHVGVLRGEGVVHQ